MKKMAILGFCLAGLAMTQHHQSQASEKAVALYKGLGTWQRPISTRSPEAQKFFNQGLILLYGFNRYEALRSFRRAAELDRQSTMAYWGMAMAQGPYINMDGDPSYDLKGACTAASEGLKLTEAPERERAWLRAVSTWCPEYRPREYTEAMRAIAERYPDDPDAQTIYAESLMIPARWHWYGPDGKPAEGMMEAERALTDVMRRWPGHPGANHYYIHAVESSPNPERAIPSAQRLMGGVPSAGHMVHMPAHIWLLTGDWDLAASLNERAAEVDREYFASSNVHGGTYMPYFVHNLHFVVYARMMQGNRGEGMRAAATFAREMSPMEAAMPEMADAFSPVPIFASVRFGEWDEILKMPQPKASMPATTTMWRYARTLALTARGDRQAAGRERDAFETLRRAVPAEAPWGQNKAADVLAVASEVLAARTAETPAAGVPHWRRAVEMQDRLVYDEPPAWYYPIRESLGAALLRAGNAAESESVFREGTRRSPRNGRMLFGLTEALKAQSKNEDAAWVSREFETVWAKSDLKLRLEDL